MSLHSSRRLPPLLAMLLISSPAGNALASWHVEDANPAGQADGYAATANPYYATTPNVVMHFSAKGKPTREALNSLSELIHNLSDDTPLAIVAQSDHGKSLETVIQRAAATRAALVALGVSPARLTTSIDPAAQLDTDGLSAPWVRVVAQPGPTSAQPAQRTLARAAAPAPVGYVNAQATAYPQPAAPAPAASALTAEPVQTQPKAPASALASNDVRVEIANKLLAYNSDGKLDNKTAITLLQGFLQPSQANTAAPASPAVGSKPAPLPSYWQGDTPAPAAAQAMTSAATSAPVVSVPASASVPAPTYTNAAPMPVAAHRDQQPSWAPSTYPAPTIPAATSASAPQPVAYSQAPYASVSAKPTLTPIATATPPAEASAANARAGNAPRANSRSASHTQPADTQDDDSSIEAMASAIEAMPLPAGASKPAVTSQSTAKASTAKAKAVDAALASPAEHGTSAKADAAAPASAAGTATTVAMAPTPPAANTAAKSLPLAASQPAQVASSAAIAPTPSASSVAVTTSATTQATAVKPAPTVAPVIDTDAHPARELPPVITPRPAPAAPDSFGEDKTSSAVIAPVIQTARPVANLAPVIKPVSAAASSATPAVSILPPAATHTAALQATHPAVAPSPAVATPASPAPTDAAAHDSMARPAPAVIGHQAEQKLVSSAPVAVPVVTPAPTTIGTPVPASAVAATPAASGPVLVSEAHSAAGALVAAVPKPASPPVPQGANPAPVVSAPASVAAAPAPQTAWTLNPSKTLKENLDDWARQAGYHKPKWTASNYIQFDTPHTFNGSFLDAISAVRRGTTSLINIDVWPDSRDIKVTDK